MPETYTNVGSMHFRGSPQGKGIPQIDSSLLINGSSFVPPTVSQFANRWSYDVDGKDAVFRTTSGNTYRTLLENLRYGAKTQIDDENIPQWKAAAEDFHPSLPRNNLIPVMPEIGYIRGMRVGMHTPHEGDTPPNLQVSNDLMVAVPMNKVGHYVSKTADLERVFKSMMKGGEHYHETQEWTEYVSKEGIATSKGKIYAIGTQKGKFLAGHYGEGKHIVVRETNLREGAKANIEAFGASGYDATEAFLRRIMFHELQHEWIGGTGKDEARQGKIDFGLYSRLAKKYQGTRKGQIYSAIARAADFYRQRYEGGDDNHEIYDYGKQQAIALEARLNAEADAIGLKGYARTEYISSRMSEVNGVLSEKRGKTGHKSGHDSSLEDRVEETEDSNRNEKREYSSRAGAQYFSSPKYSKNSKAKKGDKLKGKEDKGKKSKSK